MATSIPTSYKSDLGPAGLKGFFRITEEWQLSTDEQIKLLNVPASTFHGWRSNPSAARLHHDTLERISYILGIYKNLHILLGDKKLADAWIRNPNKATPFGGRPAIERMISGNVGDLFVVRRYLDGQVRG